MHPAPTYPDAVFADRALFDQAIRAESDECELGYDGCTGTDLELVEDPYLADVHDRPGVMIRVCPACLAQRHTDV